MKKRILTCTLIFLLFVSFYPASLKSQFSDANSLYEDGEFNRALENYLKLEKSISSWKLYYNIGNSYFKLGDMLRSKIYYLKAQKLDPLNKSIKKNLEIVESALRNDIHLPEEGFLSKVLMKIESIITIDALSVLLILLLLIFMYFEFMLVKKGRNKKYVYGIIISLTLIIIFFSLHILRVNKINTNKIAVVIVNDSKLRSGPGEINTVLFDISPGVTVKIVDKNRNWVQVTASDEIAGWIETANIQIIE